MHKKLLTLTIALSLVTGLVFSLPGTALADCVTVGDNTTCDTTTDSDGNGDNAVDANGVSVGGGDDTITIDNGATVDNEVNAGVGNDNVTNNGTVNGHILMSAGQDVVENNGDVNGSIRSTVGGDTITNNGNVSRNISTGDGRDTIVNNGTVDQAVLGGMHDDQITNNGTAGSLHGQNGDDVVVNNATVEGQVGGGPGDDQITNNNTVGAWIAGGPGDDQITNNGTADSIHASSGNDVIVNNGDLVGDGRRGWGPGDLAAGSGNDRITNNGTADEIRGADGDDTIINTGTAGEIQGGSDNWGADNDNGSDNVTNSGTVERDISTGPGDDTVTLSTGTQVGGVIDGGDDTDTINFNMATYSSLELNLALDAIAAAIAGGGDGQFNWDGGTIQWQNFEILVENLILLFLEAGPRDIADEILGFDIVGTRIISVVRVGDGSIKITLSQASGASAASPQVSISQIDWANASTGDVLVSVEVNGVLVYVVALGNGQFAFQFYSTVDGSLISNMIITP